MKPCKPHDFCCVLSPPPGPATFPVFPVSHRDGVSGQEDLSCGPRATGGLERLQFFHDTRAIDMELDIGDE